MSDPAAEVPESIVYPDSDGKPMADNTLQFDWITMLKENLDAALPGFVGGNILWYPVRGRRKIRIAPDVLVAPGRPKGYRGSYKQWQEANEAPAVVFEVLSPGNTVREMLRKLGFYDRHGAEEFYVVDPDVEVVEVFVRSGEALREVSWVGEFTSPSLGIRFRRTAGRLQVFHADGRRFLTAMELEAERLRLSAELDATRTALDTATAERDAATAERDRLLARLRELGIEP